MQIFQVERNDFCPCGSGRKYKKCCLARVEEVNYVLNQMVGPEVTALGRQILDTLAFICGLKIEEETAPPDPERVGRLLREAWEEEAEREEMEPNGVEGLTERLVRLLQEKEYLRDVRLPLDLVYEVEEVAQRGKKVDEFFVEISELLAEDLGFIINAVYSIAFSLRNDRYTDVELKTLLSGIEFLVDDALRQVFTTAVAIATLMEIEEGNERIKAMFEGAEEYDAEAELDFLDFARQHPFYGEYIYAKLLEDAQPFLTALKEHKVKLVPPFYAVIQACYVFIAKILECLPAMITERDTDDAVFYFQWAAECLWEYKEVEYFLPALLQLLIDQAETAGEEELVSSAEALFMAVKLSLFLDEPDLLELLYAACLHGFISSLPLTLKGADVTISKVGDVLDEQFITRYAEWLKEQGKEKEGEYVWQQFQLRHKEVQWNTRGRFL